MRVLFLTHYTSLYGANRSLLMLVRGLEREGIECAVLLPWDGELKRVLDERGVLSGVVPFRPWMGSERWKAPYRSLKNIRALPSLRDWAEDWDPTIVYSNSSVLPAGAYLSAISGIPHIWHVREFGWSDYGLHHDLGRRWFRLWLRRADAVIAVSRAVKANVVAPLEVSCDVLYDAVVTTDEHQALGRECLHDDVEAPFTFGIVGVLRPEKGQWQAIRATAQLSEKGRDCRLVIVGSGSEAYERRLRDLARDREILDRIRFTGFVDDPFAVYPELDALLMCSEHEAMGRVTAEAMASSRPVIGRRSGGTPELIDEGRTGFLYDGTTEGLADRMEELMDDPDRTRRMGREGWRVAGRRFVMKNHVSGIKDVIERVATRDRRT